MTKILRNFANKLRGMVHAIPGYMKLRWFFVRPKPITDNGKILLNVGCGKTNSLHYINIDLAPLPHVHYLRSALSPTMWKTESADLIYASHVLEHVGHHNVSTVLENWYSFLKKGGVLRLSVPDFDLMLAMYRESGKDLNEIIEFLMGGQRVKYDFHYTVFNKALLETKLLSAGFKTVRPWKPQQCEFHDFEDWSSFTYSINGKDIPISLNLEAIK